MLGYRQKKRFSVNKIFSSLLLVVTISAGLVTLTAYAQTTPTAVTSYHYNTLRTDWNSVESILSAKSFPSTFGLLQTVTLDDQVDAQPLLVPGLQIAGGPRM